MGFGPKKIPNEQKWSGKTLPNYHHSWPAFSSAKKFLEYVAGA